MTFGWKKGWMHAWMCFFVDASLANRQVIGITGASAEQLLTCYQVNSSYIPKPFRAPDHSWPTFRVLLMCLCQAFSIKAIGDKIFHPPQAEVGHSTVCTRLIPFVLWEMLLNRDPYQNLWHYVFFAEAEETEVELFSDEEVEVLRTVLFESFWPDFPRLV